MFAKLISKIETDLNNLDFKALVSDFETFQKQVENSKQFFEKEGKPAYITKVLADIEDGLSKGK